MKRALGILAILLIIGGGVFAYYWLNRPKAAKEVKGPSLLASLEAGGKNAFFAGGGKEGLFIAGKDGARFIGLNGADAMNKQYELKNPQVTGAGGYIAVYEAGGSVVYVCSQTPQGYQVATPAPIYNAGVNRRGWLSLLMSTESGVRLCVYNQSGDLQLEGEFLDPRLVPICADVSEDGRVAAVAFADFSGAAISSCVNFYNVNKSEAGDGLFAFSGDYPGRLIADMTFFGDVLICAADDALLRFETDKQNLSKAEIALESRVSAISLEDNHIAVALEGGAVRIYDNKFALRGEYDSGLPVGFLACGNGGVVVGSGVNGAGSFTALTYSGEALWGKEAAADVRQAYLINGKTIALCGAGSVYIEPVKE